GSHGVSTLSTCRLSVISSWLRSHPMVWYPRWFSSRTSSTPSCPPLPITAAFRAIGSMRIASGGRAHRGALCAPRSGVGGRGCVSEELHLPKRPRRTRRPGGLPHDAVSEPLNLLYFAK